MNATETTRIMGLLEAAYPQFYSKQSGEERGRATRLWAMMFSEEPYRLVEAATAALIKSRNSDFPPSIGELNVEIQRISAPEEMTELEAWSLVAKATKNAAYGSAEEFAKLPATVQRLVGSPNQLREWAMMDSDVFNSVIASNFQRSYRARVASDKAMQALPAPTKAYLAELAGGLELELPEPAEDLNALRARIANYR